MEAPVYIVPAPKKRRIEPDLFELNPAPTGSTAEERVRSRGAAENTENTEDGAPDKDHPNYARVNTLTTYYGKYKNNNTPAPSPLPGPSGLRSAPANR